MSFGINEKNVIINVLENRALSVLSEVKNCDLKDVDT